MQEDNIFVFFGPTLHYNYISPSYELNMFVSIGAMNYTSEATLNKTLEVTSKGDSIGFDIGVEYLFNFNHNLFFGGSLSYTTSSIDEVITSVAGVSETVEFDEPEALNHISIGPVIRLYF